MIIVYTDQNTGKILRPAPLVSISFNSKRNKLASLGGDYNITINGVILASGGSPVGTTGNIYDRIASSGINFDDSKYPQGTPPNETWEYKYDKPMYEPPIHSSMKTDNNNAFHILKKQEAIRALFSRDGQKVEISPITNDQPIIICYPVVESINFEQGTYVNKCNYSINLTAPVLYDKNNKPYDESYQLIKSENNHFNSLFPSATGSPWVMHSGLIEDFSDTWSLEPDESFFIKTDPNIASNRSVPRMYRITRNVSATGKTYYAPDGNDIKMYEAWENARRFIKEDILLETGINASRSHFSFPGLSGTKYFGHNLLALSGNYEGYNHVRTESIDKAAGSYTINDTWLLTSGNNNTIESYDLSLSSSTDSPFINITLNGKIKGLTKIMSDVKNNTTTSNISEPFNNAIKEYYRLSNHDKFGIGCALYKRASCMSPIQLNSTPLNSNITINKLLGEIDYNVTFNNRPLTFFSDVLTESITINDTYPGDIYAIMPVLNRTTGPLFQLIGGISQYERSLSIDFVVSKEYLYNDGVKMTNKINYLLRSPSKNIGSTLYVELEKLIKSYSPAYEPYIRKYLVNPISEQWDPKTGKYSVNISWVYELDQ